MTRNLTLARVLAAQGEADAARHLLRKLMKELGNRGLFGFLLGAECTLGELDVTAGHPGGNSRLKRVAQEAERRGFALLAKRARAATTRP